jgi:hypothetical protein
MLIGSCQLTAGQFGPEDYFRGSGSYLLESGRQMDHCYGNPVFPQRTEIDFREIVNAFRESDRFRLSKSYASDSGG